MGTIDYDDFIGSHTAPMHNVYQSVWKDYELLCDLLAGSDFDGDSAYYWSESYEASKEILHKISFEWSVDGITWKECIGINGTEGTAFFPGHNYAKAKAGFYLPFLSFHLEELRTVGFRAVVPREILRMTSRAKNPFSTSESVPILDEENREVAYASMHEGKLRFENGWSGNTDELSLEIIYTVPPESFPDLNKTLGYSEEIPIGTVITLVNHDGNGQRLWNALNGQSIPNVERFTWLS